MPNNNLTGTLPPALASLPGLVRLYVAIDVCGSIDRTMAGLTWTVPASPYPRRILGNNKLVGTVPVGLGNSTALTYMCVGPLACGPFVVCLHMCRCFLFADNEAHPPTPC
jgi:hypothetical protein